MRILIFDNGNFMLCPYGHKKGTNVVDSRVIRDGRAVRRRRQCASCDVRFTTYEEIEPMRLVVVKRDGSHEEYLRSKIRSGVAKAIEKRPQEKQLDEIVQKIEYGLLEKFGKRGIVRARDIGRATLAHLEEIDEVAYLRFASVYKSFGSAKSFRKEVERFK